MSEYRRPGIYTTETDFSEVLITKVYCGKCLCVKSKHFLAKEGYCYTCEEMTETLSKEEMRRYKIDVLTNEGNI